MMFQILLSLSLNWKWNVFDKRKNDIHKWVLFLNARCFVDKVDEDCFLHDEVDPRYRGAAIPSRAFRMLQSMTDAAEASGDPTCGTRV